MRQRVTAVVPCVCVCVFLSTGANPQTGASRRLTEGTSGLSGTFLTILERRFVYNCFVIKLEAL